LQRFPNALRPFVLFAAAALCACAGMPAQQMYDATQAVRAAEKAGAAQYAPELLSEAQAHLKVAKTSLHSGDYRVARDEAEAARGKAMEARSAAETATATHTGAPGP
jgi:hypothetical protein